MQALWDKVHVYVVLYGMRVLAALVIFVLGRWVAHMASHVVERALRRAKVREILVTFVKNLSYYALLAFVIVAALNKLGIETNSFIAIIGAAGLAVGLALQGSLSNFAAGVMMVLFEPFEIGDTVEAGGAAGKVKEIQIFSTIIHTPDGKTVIVPNAKITGDKIVIYPKS